MTIDPIAGGLDVVGMVTVFASMPLAMIVLALPAVAYAPSINAPIGATAGGAGVRTVVLIVIVVSFVLFFLS